MLLFTKRLFHVKFARYLGLKDAERIIAIKKAISEFIGEYIKIIQIKSRLYRSAYDYANAYLKKKASKCQYNCGLLNIFVLNIVRRRRKI